MDLTVQQNMPNREARCRRDPSLLCTACASSIIQKKNPIFTNEQIAFIVSKYLYNRIFKKHRKPWVILGDETETLAEFLRKESGEPRSSHELDRRSAEV